MKQELVIMTDALIEEKSINEMIVEDLSSSELAKLLQIDGLDSNLVLSLEMEHCRLLNVSNLWKFKMLSKLILANNFVEEIEGIENLPNLQYIDLSFNCIKTVRGLDGLSNLSYLNLSFNEIVILENMESLTKLESFFVRHNKIQSFDHILYLSQFKNLLCLGVSGNPVTEKENIRLCIISILPQLKFLDFNMITDDELKEALSEYPFENKNLNKFRLKDNQKFNLSNEQFSILLKPTVSDEEALVDGLANGRGFDTFLDCDKNFSLLLSFPSACIIADNHRKVISEIFDLWHHEGHKYYKEMEEEKMKFTKAIKDAHYFSLSIFEDEENSYITFKEEIAKKLCLIYQENKSPEEKEKALKKLKEKCDEELLKTNRNLLNISCLNIDLIYKLRKIFSQEMIAITRKYLHDVRQFCERIMMADKVHLIQLRDFYFKIFDSGSNFDLKVTDENEQAINLEPKFLQLLTKKEFVEITLTMTFTIHSAVLDERIKKLKISLRSYVADIFNQIIENGVLIKQNEQYRNIVVFCNKQKYIIDKLFSNNAIYEHYLGYR